jgi:hypothetical protein
LAIFQISVEGKYGAMITNSHENVILKSFVNIYPKEIGL